MRGVRSDVLIASRITQHPSTSMESTRCEMSSSVDLDVYGTQRACAQHVGVPFQLFFGVKSTQGVSLRCRA
jgi:hypothetical protein